MSQKPARNYVRELDRSSPAANHIKLGTTLDALQKAHNLLADVLVNPAKVSLGSPIAVDTDYLVKAATSTNLPANATPKVYTTATDNTAPLDGVVAAPTTILMTDAVEHLVWTLDVPRNITSSTTHGSSIVAMTVLVEGFDVNKNALSELLTIGAGTTGPTVVAGKKAFKYIEKFTIVTAGNATTNTLNIGIGDVLGLPHALTEKDDFIMCYFNHVAEAAAALVVADTGAVSTTSGDSRGTIDMTSASNGSQVTIWYNIGVDNSGYTVTPISEI